MAEVFDFPEKEGDLIDLDYQRMIRRGTRPNLARPIAEPSAMRRFAKNIMDTISPVVPHLRNDFDLMRNEMSDRVSNSKVEPIALVVQPQRELNAAPVVEHPNTTDEFA